MTRVWFVTGTSRGLGRAIAEVALERGDRVAATARDVGSLQALAERYGEAILPLQVDVTERDAVDAAVARAHETFGRLDIVCNNAGYAILGAVEEVDEEDIRAQFEVNFFGVVRVVQAALPYLRAQGSGHVIQISSVGGVLSFPMVGFYCASKWALEAMSESLAAETAGLGVKVTVIEPGAMRTEWPQSSIVVAPPIDAYARPRTQRLEAMADEYQGLQPGDPRRAADAVLRVADADDPPLRVILGNAAYDITLETYRSRLAQWESWESLSRATDFGSA